MRRAARLLASLVLLLVTAGCGGPEVASPTTLATTTTATAGAPSTTATTTAPEPPDIPELVLTSRQVWDPPRLELDPGPFVLRNELGREAFIQVNEGDLGEWTLADGESVLVDVSNELPRLMRVRARIGLASATSFVDTRPAAEVVEIGPEDLIVDLSPVRTASTELDNLTWIYYFTNRAERVRWTARLDAPVDWHDLGGGGWVRTFDSETDQAALFVTLQDLDREINIARWDQIEDVVAETGVRWQLYVSTYPEFPQVIATHAIGLFETGYDELGPLVFWVTLRSAEGDHQHLTAEVLRPALDTLEFTAVAPDPITQDPSP